MCKKLVWHFFENTFFLNNICSKSCFWKVFWPPFIDLINSVASRNVWKLLNLSYLQKVVKTFFKKPIYLVKKFEQIIKLGLKSTRRGLLVRKNGTDGFKSGFDTAIVKSAKNAADPAKNHGFTKYLVLWKIQTLQI